MTPEPEWVDLGLPSGLKWAKCNLGANVPEGSGFYYSWGNTEGHPKNSGYNFNQENYDESPAAAISSNLTLAQDAAHQKLGSKWRMPSEIEVDELLNNCTSVFTTLNGVRGRLFTSNINGATIFMPVTGFYNGIELQNDSTYGMLWTSTYGSATNAHRLFFNVDEIIRDTERSRITGLCIRPVFDPNI